MNSSYLSKHIISSTMECDVTLVNSNQQSQQQQLSSSHSRQQINSVAVTISGSLSSSSSATENHKKHHDIKNSKMKATTTNNHQIIPQTTITTTTSLSPQTATAFHSRIHTIQQTKPQIQIIHQTNNQPTSSSASAQQHQQNRHFQNNHYAQQKIQLTTTPIFIPKQLPPKLSKLKSQLVNQQQQQQHHQHTQQQQQNKLITTTTTTTPTVVTTSKNIQQLTTSEIDHRQNPNDEIDPLAIDNTQIIPESSQIALGLQKQNPPQYVTQTVTQLSLPSSVSSSSTSTSKTSKIVKHTHSLRRPRIIFKPIPEKSSASTPSQSTQNKLEKNDKINSNIGLQLRHSTLSTTTSTSVATASTMREVLASIPGFTMKTSRRRSNKKISTAAQIEQTKDGKIDLETPDSVLVCTNLRALLNKHTFSLLPPLYQYNLVQLLPNVDCPDIDSNTMKLMNPEHVPSVRLNASSLNNEFFARACLEWRERLAEGEFTSENQVKLKSEAEKEKNKLDPWKLKHFEPIWGGKNFKNFSTTATMGSGNNNKNNNISSVVDKKHTQQQQLPQIKQQETLSSSSTSSSSRPALKTTIKLNKSIASIPSSSSLSSTNQSTIYTTTASVVSTTVSPASTSYSNLPKENNLTDINSMNSLQQNNQLVNSIGNFSPKKLSRNSGGAVTRAQQQQQQQINDEINNLKIETNNQENYLDNDNILTETSKQQQLQTTDLVKNETVKITNTTTPIIKTEKLKCESVILENKLKLNETSIDNIKSEFNDEDEYKCSLSTTPTKTAIIDNESTACGTVLYEIEVNCFNNLKSINNNNKQEQIQHNQFDNSTNTTTTIINKSRTLKRSSSSPEYICDNNSSKQIKYSINENQNSNNNNNQIVFDDDINNYSTTYTDDGLSSSGGDSIVNLDNNLTEANKIYNNNKLIILEHEETIGKLIDNNELSYEHHHNQEHQQQQHENQLTNNLNNPSEESCSNDMLSEKTSCNSLELDTKLELNDDLYGKNNHNNNVLINDNNDNCNNTNLNLINEIINDINTNHEDDKLLLEQTATVNVLLKDHDDEVISNDYQNSIEAGTSSGYSLHETTTAPFSTATVTIKSEAASTTNSFNFQGNPFNFHQTQNIPSSSLAIIHNQQQEQSNEDDLMDNFMGSGDLRGDGTAGVGAMLTCSEETSSSTSGLVDCSGDNSADDNAIEELESNIQQISTIPQSIEDDPIEQKFADAENYLLETAGEISTDSGEASNVALIDGIKLENQENIFGTIIEDIPSTSNSAILNAVDEDLQQRQHLQQHQQKQQQLEEDNFRTQQQSETISFLSSLSLSSMTQNGGGVINRNTAINSNIKNNQNMVQQQNILTTNDIYQHIKHDWNFGIKVESNQSAMMDSTSSTDVNGLGGVIPTTASTNIFLQQNQLQNVQDNLPQQLLKNEQEEQNEDESEQQHKCKHNDDDNDQQQQQQQHNIIEVSEGVISASTSNNNNNVNTDNRAIIINNQEGAIYQNHEQQHNHMHHQLNHQNYNIVDNGAISQISNDLEIPMAAAEMEVSSTVVSNNSTNSNDSLSNQSINDVIMQQQQQNTNNSTKLLLTSQQQQQILRQQQNFFAFQANQNLQQQLILKNVTPTGVTQYTAQQHNLQAHTLQQQQQLHLNIQPQQSNIHQMPSAHQQQHHQNQHQQINNNNKVIKTHQQQQSRTTSNPTGYISLSSNQPLKVIPNTGIPSTIATQRPKILPNNNGNNNNNSNNNGTNNSSNNTGKGRRSSNKLPPGAVNLERSYQICQAVIQNSPNRHQLTAQLRPPPSMMASSTSSSTNSTTTMTTTLVGSNNVQQQQQQQKKIEEQIVTSTGGSRTVYKVIGPRLGFPRRKFVPRQASPTLIRHVYTAAGSGVNGGTTNPTIQIQQHNHHQQQLMQSVVDQQQQTQSVAGRYVLVHRANVCAADNQAPRASSAPPAQNQQLHGVNGVPVSGRGRPASVDVDTPNNLHDVQVQHVIGPNPGVQAVTRRISQGYGDISIDQNHQTYVVTSASGNSSGENTPPNCVCSLNPMIICQQCGAFMHDDCAAIGSAKLCVSCVIR